MGAAANPNEEMAFDKARYEKATEVKRQAAHVAAAAVALAKASAGFRWRSKAQPDLDKRVSGRSISQDIK